MTMPSRPPRQRERSEQAAIVQLLRSLGAKVYTLGTTRRRGDFQGTMQTPGLPDLIAFLKWPAPTRDGRIADTAAALGLTRQLLVIECKAPGGRLRPEQIEFRDHVRAAGIAHITGGVDAVITWLIEHEHLRRDQVAHYRAPAAKGIAYGR